MVILQFNKLIRNKWIWGAFAVAVSAFFCFDDALMRGQEERVAGSAGTLAGESVASDLFQGISEDVRGFGQNRDWKRKASEVNRQAWEILALMKTAEANGLTATDKEVSEAIKTDRSFQQNGTFSFAMYNQLLRSNGLTPERFEQYMKRRLTMTKLGDVVLGAAAWVSPMELDRAVSDMTDEYSVRVARFSQKKEDADKVELTEEMLKKWYDDNSKSLALPDRAKLRLVKFDAKNPDVLAKMTVSDDEMHDRYDVTSDKYTTTDTNGVEKVKAFEEVKDEIEKELRLLAAVQYFETNLNQRVWGVKAAEGASRVDEIAAEDGLQVQPTGWLALDGSVPQGFAISAGIIAPKANGFLDAVAQLDPTVEDMRYGIVTGEDAVYLVEIAERSEAHVPTYEEAKEIVRPRALVAAKADAFKASVEAVIAAGAAEVAAKADSVTTNFVFAINKLTPGQFDDQNAVARAAMKTMQGEVSEFALTGVGKAIVVICDGRTAGDAAEAAMVKESVRYQLSVAQRRSTPNEWQKWLLDSLGFEPGDGASVIEAEEVE